MKPSRYKLLFISLLAAMVVLNVAMLWYGRSYMAQGYGDFTAFYTAGKLLQRGQASGLYDARFQWEVQREFASSVSIRNGPLPYIRPPFQAIIFFPFAYLNYRLAFAAWMAIKLCILFCLPFLLRPHVLGRTWLSARIAGVLSLSVAAVAIDLLQGQDAVLFLLVCALAFTAMSSGSDLMAGVWLGLGLFKFHLILPIILVLALRKQGRTVLGFGLTALCLFFVSAALVGWGTLLHYPSYLWDLSHRPGTGVMQAPSMPNLRGFIHVLLPSPQWQRWGDWCCVPLALLGIGAAGKIWPARRDRVHKELFVAGFCFCLAIAILVSFYFSGYDMMLLLLPAFLLTPAFVRSLQLPAWSKAIFVGSLGFLLLVPVSWTQLLHLHLERWDTLALLSFTGVVAYAMNIWRKDPSISPPGQASS